MYFELMQGIHSDVNGRMYKIVVERDAKGNEISRTRPVIETDSDLIANYGTGKFRRLSDAESKVLLEQEGKQFEPVVEKDTAVGSAMPKSKVALAAEKGALELGHENVSDSFPKAKAAGLSVFKMKTGGYFVLDAQNGVALSKDGELKSKIQVNSFVKQYVEK